MRTKFVRNSKTNRRELLIASQRGETLAGKLADLLVDDPSALLLGFAYEKQRGGGALLHYDVDGLWSLRTYLAKRALGVDEVRGLLEATQGVLDLCAEQHLRAEGLLFDPEFVFVDAQCCPHFALVPLEDMPFEPRNSPLALLAPLGDTDKLRFSSPDAEGMARRLGGLVLDLEGVFSANRFRRFVRDELRQGEGAVCEARRSVVDPGTSSVWATAGATSEQPTADSSSLFWSPLAGFAEEGPQEAAPAASVAEPAQALAPIAPPVASGSVSTPVISVTPPTVPPAAALAAEPTPVVASANSASSWQAPTPKPHNPGVELVRPMTGERHTLPMGMEVVAGRGSSCAIRLRGNPKISRTHVALTWTGQVLVVRDLGAVNGVWVDGYRLTPQQPVTMMPGQRLRLADEEFEIRNVW